MLKKTKLTLTISAIALSAGMLGVAAARQDHEGPPHPRQLERKFDTNGDGKLDDAERAAMRKQFEARHAEHHKKLLAQFDKNRDGKLDDAERDQMMEQQVAEHFKKLDADGNGAVTLQEFKAGMKLRHKRIFLGPPGGGPPPGGPDVMIFHGEEDDE